MRFIRRILPVTIALAVLSGCVSDAEPRSLHGLITVATGNAGGVYAVYGEGFAELIRDMTSADAHAVPTAGSVENLRLVSTGHANVAFTLADAAADAVAGQPPFAAKQPIVALARLYDNYAHLVVRADGPIHALAELAGHRLSVGDSGSGTEVLSNRILAAAGLDQRITQVNLDIGASAHALESGEVDAFFWCGGLPSQAIVDLRSRMELRLVDLASVVEPLALRYGDFYRKAVVPASVYRLPRAVTTIQVPNYLVVRRDIEESQAYWLTRLLFDGQRRLAVKHPEARRLDISSAIATFPLELHQGAVRWYRHAHM